MADGKKEMKKEYFGKTKIAGPNRDTERGGGTNNRLSFFLFTVAVFLPSRSSFQIRISYLNM
jgi:hypothetical protein